MNNTEQTFQARQREATSKALSEHAANLRRLIEELRSDAEIIAADPNTFQSTERDAYAECIRGLHGWEDIIGKLARKLNQEIVP